MPEVGVDSYGSRFNRGIAVTAWVLCVAAAIGLFFAPQQRALLGIVPLALVALLAWEGLWRPRVVADDEGVELRNIGRTIVVPWPALVHVETRWSMTLITPGHRWPAYAAPAPSRPPRREEAVEQRRATPGFDLTDQRPGDLRGTESGDAAFLVRRRWNALLDAGRIPLGVAETTPVAVRWHVPSLVAVAVLLAASVPAVLLGF